MNVPAVSSLSSVSLHGFLVAKAYFSVYVRFTTNLGLLYVPLWLFLKPNNLISNHSDSWRAAKSA